MGYEDYISHITEIMERTRTLEENVAIYKELYGDFEDRAKRIYHGKPGEFNCYPSSVVLEECFHEGIIDNSKAEKRITSKSLVKEGLKFGYFDESDLKSGDPRFEEVLEFDRDIDFDKIDSPEVLHNIATDYLKYAALSLKENEFAYIDENKVVRQLAENGYDVNYIALAVRDLSPTLIRDEASIGVTDVKAIIEGKDVIYNDCFARNVITRESDSLNRREYYLVLNNEYEQKRLNLNIDKFDELVEYESKLIAQFTQSYNKFFDKYTEYTKLLIKSEVDKFDDEVRKKIQEILVKTSTGSPGIDFPLNEKLIVPLKVFRREFWKNIDEEWGDVSESYKGTISKEPFSDYKKEMSVLKNKAEGWKKVVAVLKTPDVTPSPLMTADKNYKCIAKGKFEEAVLAGRFNKRFDSVELYGKKDVEIAAELLKMDYSKSMVASALVKQSPALAAEPETAKEKAKNIVEQAFKKMENEKEATDRQVEVRQVENKSKANTKSNKSKDGPDIN